MYKASLEMTHQTSPFTLISSARKTETPFQKTPRQLLLENPYTPTSTIAQALMQSSPLFSELIVVREWLQEIAPLPSVPEASTGYWKFTKYNVMQALRTGKANNNASGGKEGGLVKEMDPDVVSREIGKTLAPDDAVCFLKIAASSHL
jgi:nuclear pore complex protein Nup107